jgi:hypothetical protein
MKTIVYINTDFYSYNKEIIHSLNDLGYQVLFFDYKPCCKSFSKFLFRFDGLFRKRVIRKLVRKIHEATEGKEIESYLFINPTTFTAEDVKQIFAGHEKARKILYLWDSTRTYPCVLDIVSLFDQVFSFDPQDCRKYGYQYRATFSCAEDLSMPSQQDFHYDLFYIASYSKERYRILRKMIDYCDSNGLSIYYHLYIKNHLAYAFYKLSNPGLKKKYVRFFTLSNAEKAKIQNQSRCILDTPLSTQSGITMRVIEGLVLKKKILTSNPDITGFSFYNPDDFFLFTDENISIDKEKIQRPIHYQIDESYYSVHDFVAELLGEAKTK